MNDLIKVATNNENGKQTVIARELHEFLEVGTRYNDWIDRRIEEYGFLEGQDFIVTQERVAKTNQKIHYISLDMAKELSMVERNTKGKQARRYFIDCEKKTFSDAPLSLDQQLDLMIAGRLEDKKKIAYLETTKAQISDKKTATAMNTASQKSKECKRLETKLQDVGAYRSVLASGLPDRVATDLNPNKQTWRVLKEISEDLDLPPVKVEDSRYGMVNTYHVDVIEQFINDYV